MAGLFEETGRFLAMRYVLKKEHGNAHNALMYGAGHGGLEMFVILSLGMINNLIYSVMIHLGQTQTLLDPLDEASRNTLQTAHCNRHYTGGKERLEKGNFLSVILPDRHRQHNAEGELSVFCMEAA